MKKLLFLLLLLPTFAFGQNQQRIAVAWQNNSGYTKLIPNAKVTVCVYNTLLQCNTPVTIYSDQALTNQIQYPFYADANGNYSWFTHAGTYVEQICGPLNQCYSNPITVIAGAGVGTAITQITATTTVTGPVIFNGPGVSQSGSTFTFSGATLQHNASNLPNQAKLNFWDSPASLTGGALDAGFQPITFKNDAVGGLAGEVPLPSGQLQPQIIPTPAGHTIIVYATAHTFPQTSLCTPTATNTSAQGANSGSGNVIAANCGVSWSGYQLPAGYSAANVTGVTAFATSSLSSYAPFRAPALSYLTCSGAGFATVALNPGSGGGYPPTALSATMGAGSGLIGNISCQVQWTANETGIGGNWNLDGEVNQIGLLVTTTDAPVYATDNILVAPPLQWNPTTNILSITSNPGANLAPATISSLPDPASVPGQSYLVKDSTSTTACTTGLGTDYVWCTSNGTAWAATPFTGAITALTGDVMATGPGSVTATVKGLNGVPFCTGFTPTNGQALQYTTASSPNPCYTAGASGGGTTTNALTAAATGGAAPGTTFNGSAAVTLDYHSVGAQQALTLTTTGTSGAATLSAGTLNIPNYSSGSGTGFNGGLGSSYQDATEIAAPANPASGNDRLYLSSSTHQLSCLTSSGGNCMPTGGSGSVSDGSGTTTANLIPVSTTTAHTIGYSTTQVVSCGGVNDTTALQNALNNAGTIIVNGNCVENSHLTIKSNTTLYAYGATFSYTATAADYLIINQGAQQIASPNRTFSDGVLTANSQTITSATAAFTSADVGSSLKCANGMGTGFYLFTEIIAVNSATSIGVADAPTTAQAADSCSIYRRDSNISILGGTYTLSGNLGKTVSYVPLFFETVNNLKLIGVNAVQPAGGFWTAFIGDVDGFTVDSYSVNTPTINEDGLHIGGPAVNGYIADVTCNTNDDCVPISTQDTSTGYAGLPAIYGNVSGITVNGVNGQEQGTPAQDEAGVKLYVSNNGATLSLKNVNVSNVIGTALGFNNGVTLLGLSTGTAQTISYVNLNNVGGTFQTAGIDENTITPTNLTFSSVFGTIPTAGQALTGIPNGSLSSPAINWGTEGIYRTTGANAGINFEVGSAGVGSFNSTGMYIANTIQIAPSWGAAAGVTLSYSGTTFTINTGTTNFTSTGNTPMSLSSSNTCCTQFELSNSTSGAHAIYFFTNGSANTVGWGGVYDATAAGNAYAFLGDTNFNLPSGSVLGWTSSTTQAAGTPDTGISRGAANVIDFGNGSAGNATAQVGYASHLPGILYSAGGTPLPACASGNKGQEAVVSDATSPTYLGAYTSGGAVVSPVICNGTGWVTY